MIDTVFLDRDGVINHDSDDYVKTPAEFAFIDQSPEAVALLTQSGFQVIVITNQAMVGRKISSMKALEAIFEKMKSGVEKAGGRFTDIFFCPHAPEENCACRKPKPGMIRSAAQKHGIDLSRSVMVGDSAKDIQCGRNAGCAKTVLVETGNGKTAFEALIRQSTPPDYLAKNLFDAAHWIIDQKRT